MSTVTSVVATETRPAPTRRRRSRWTWVFVLLSVLVALPSILPILWLISTSLKNYIQTQILPPILVPEDASLANYVNVINNGAFTYLRNSAVVTVATVLLVAVLAIPGAYALARFRLRKGRDLQFWIISLRMLPPMAVVVPVYLAFAQIGLSGSLLSIICMLTMVNAAFAVWLLTIFFEDVPVEVEEAATLDGVGRFGTMMRIAIPLARTGILTVLGFVFIFAWNELPFALVLSGQLSQTFPVFLSTFSGITLIDYGAMAAACLIHITPILLVTALLQRNLVAGLSFGAVK